jgi:hypothetical protein
VWIPEQFALGARFRGTVVALALGDALVPTEIAVEVGLRKTLVDPFEPDDCVIPGGLVLRTHSQPIGADPSITMAFLKEWRRLDTCDSTAIWIANDRRVAVESHDGLASLEECWGEHTHGWCPWDDLRRMLNVALSSAIEFKAHLLDEARSSAPRKADSIARSIVT